MSPPFKVRSADEHADKKRLMNMAREQMTFLERVSLLKSPQG